jgi:adenine phosphoribosyltransferase
VRGGVNTRTRVSGQDDISRHYHPADAPKSAKYNRLAPQRLEPELLAGIDLEFVWCLLAAAVMMWPLFLPSASFSKLSQNSGIARFRMDRFKKLIRNVPDFPKKGILFYDITTLLKNAQALKEVLNEFSGQYRTQKIDVVVGVESRGFIFAPALAYQLGAGFVPVRKPGKLPAETIKVTYDLEYGTDTLEIHKDAIQKGQRVLVVDDLLATGGTATAVARLVRQLGGELAGLAFLVELDFLNGRKKLEGYNVFSLLRYQD